MSDDRKAKKLEQVRNLLAKAERTEFEGEARVFRAKADELMTRFAIEEYELKVPGNINRTPVKRMYEMAWYRDEFGKSLWGLLSVVADHCRVQIAHLYYTGHSIPCVGMEADLDYMDMLFTNLMIELMQRIKPRPSKELSFEDNLVMLKESGLGWQEIATLVYEDCIEQFPVAVLEQLPHPNAHLESDPQRRAIEMMTNKKVIKKNLKFYGPPFAHVYRNYCKRTGHPQAYTNHMTYRRNFADGFVSIVRSRLQEMRQEQQVEAQDTNPMALVIRDIRQTVDASFLNMFPMQGDEKLIKYERRQGKVDRAARRQGEAAGREAKIHVDPQKGLKSQRELRP